TNHLDLATREALSMALNEFEGTVMLVSHDRALLRAVCDEFWLVSRGGIEPFDGDLDDYQRYLLEVARQARETQRQESREASAQAAAQGKAAQSAPADSASRGAEQRRQEAQRRQQMAERLRPVKKELTQVEQRMATLGGEKAALEAALSGTLSPDDIAQAGRRLKALADELDTCEMRWLELSEALEQASSD
ncbi:MAG: ABC transporter, partial [Gammaproteobacteria bacterium]